MLLGITDVKIYYSFLPGICYPDNCENVKTLITFTAFLFDAQNFVKLLNSPIFKFPLIIYERIFVPWKTQIHSVLLCERERVHLSAYNFWKTHFSHLTREIFEPENHTFWAKEQSMAFGVCLEWCDNLRNALWMLKCWPMRDILVV